MGRPSWSRGPCCPCTFCTPPRWTQSGRLHRSHRNNRAYIYTVYCTVHSVSSCIPVCMAWIEYPDNAKKLRERRYLGTCILHIVKMCPNCPKSRSQNYANGNDIETKANESFDNRVGVFFYIETKRTRSIVKQLFSKQNESVSLKNVKYRSDAKKVYRK